MMASFKREKRGYRVVSAALSQELVVTVDFDKPTRFKLMKLHKREGVSGAPTFGAGKTWLMTSTGATRLPALHLGGPGKAAPATAWPQGSPAEVDEGDVASAEAFWTATATAFADATAQLKKVDALLGELEQAVKETSY
jgi:hypothetical protein